MIRELTALGLVAKSQRWKVSFPTEGNSSMARKKHPVKKKHAKGGMSGDLFTQLISDVRDETLSPTIAILQGMQAIYLELSEANAALSELMELPSVVSNLEHHLEELRGDASQVLDQLQK
jgi:hypothetical protein